MKTLFEFLNHSSEYYVNNIETDTLNNTLYRNVIFTGNNLQLVLMSIPVNEEIGEETHSNGDQFLRIESGEGELIINGNTYQIKDNFAMTIPGGYQHNIKNTGTVPLKLYSIYAPPQHRKDLKQLDK